MNRTTVITLVKPGEKTDDLGYLIPDQEPVRRTVLAEKVSAVRAEFYSALKAGRRVSHVIRVRAEVYQGETAAEYLGKKYEILRDYPKGGWVELSLAEVI
ncbi:MAG TPA: phage head-tail adapter protein [Candidatus Onthovicinus excrementipullorum]|nr:phage head-tail adapter protein [Candidatus Onthovicinus excrementipullorum]